MTGTMKSAVVASLGLVLTGGMLFAVLHGSDEVIRRSSSASSALTEVVLPVPLRRVTAEIAALSHGVRGKDYRLDLKGKFADFYLQSLHEMLPLSDSRPRINSDENPALERYWQLGDAARKDDFVLSPRGDVFWSSSEYTYRGKPAPFSCSFVIHLEPVEGTATRLEVIEASPIVRAGKWFGWSAHTGPFPRFFDDIRPVAPTVEDRQELLSSLERVLNGG